jgi:hypothetical protein
MDVVGYSKLLINEQRAVRETLNQIVRQTDQFRKADAAGNPGFEKIVASLAPKL